MLTSITVHGTVLRRLQNMKDSKRKYMQIDSLDPLHFIEMKVDTSRVCCMHALTYMYMLLNYL